MLENIKTEIYQNLNELFAHETLDQMAGDMENYRKKLLKIASIAEILGMDTQIIQVSINLKSSKVQ